MLVLSRQIDETVMIGDTILVTVLSISAEMATLHIRYARDEQKCALEIDDRIEITDDIHVSVIDIRGDKVRLGVEAPKALAVHRKEVFEAIRKENRAAASTKGPIIVGVGQTLRVGESLRIKATIVNETEGVLSCTGLLIGGAEDGMPFVREAPIVIGSQFDLGTLVRVSVMGISSGTISLQVDRPMHMMMRKEQ